jgi:hypothetical protein
MVCAGTTLEHNIHLFDIVIHFMSQRIAHLSHAEPLTEVGADE